MLQPHWDSTLARAAEHNTVLCLQDTTGRKLKEVVAAEPALGEVRFTLPKGRKRPSRSVTLSIRVARVELKQQQLPITVVMAEEQSAPAGATPVSWILLSNIQVETLSGAQELLNWYLCCWEIELFFKTLKSGCRVESMQLRSREKLERLLVIKMIVAWRVMYLMRLNRVVPEHSCELVFDPEEWRIIYASTLRKTPPKEAPSLRTLLHLVASYGSFLGRKGDGEPGLQTLWLGLERCHDMVRAIQETKELLG
ncbi:IS4 family transposase [Oceanisphaera arctica]|uniref:Transposase Tn5 dimerisation domain-containing protein n=1 Tax=Oceanisphaera arctica TaxID=641510 RepID=A0A2P5TPL7_9GAMM|nr:IS4 family transposase [Oceanisphaera arctica]PPL17659.1 hypothetical protein UN63_03570 [Oceanisphaera arctica]GHA18891.1 hypothetical protein GCM10007082_19440 [Oceanisphaera arctica]